MFSINGYTPSIAEIVAVATILIALLNAIVSSVKSKSDKAKTEAETDVSKATAEEIRVKARDALLDTSADWIDRLQKELNSCQAQLSKIQDDLTAARSREQMKDMRIRELEYLRADDREGITTLILQLRKHDIPPAWQPDDYIPALKPPVVNV